VHLLVDPGFYPPLNFYEASRFVPLPPTRWTPRTDKTDTDERTIRPSVRLLDGANLTLDDFAAWTYYVLLASWSEHS